MAILAASTAMQSVRATGRRQGPRRSAVLACVVVPFLCNLPASAAPNPGPESATVSDSATPTPEVKKKAAGHFETGLKLYEDGDFSLALIEFERAYSYVPDYRVLFNIGQVSVQLGRYARAVKALKQYLQAGSKSILPARAASVQEDLKMLEGRTAQLRIDCNVDGAEILLDDIRIGVTPMEQSLLVDAGEHRLTLQKPGYVTRMERVVLAGRDEISPHFELAEVAKAVELPSRQPSVAQQLPKVEAAVPPRTMSTRTQLLYAGAGATSLFVVAWAVTGYVGISAASDLHEALQRPTSQGELDSYRNRARGALIASDILGVAAVIAGTTTLYFTLKGPSKEQPRTTGSRIDVRFTPSAMLVTGAF